VNGVLIIGAGGHARVVADILLASDTPVTGFLDDKPDSWGTSWMGISVLGPVASFQDYAPTGLVLGIGSNADRFRIAEQLDRAAGQLWRNAIHPSAIISPSVRLGRGIVVCAGAIINPDATIGDHTIVNTAATIDHDGEIADAVHIAPGVHLAGQVRVGTGALLGIGTTVIPGRTIGAWSVLGAGCVVTSDIPAHTTAVGVPARVIRRRSPDEHHNPSTAP
jgi:sugar O-acyltransferase (sialic acid O-acetyltransferase NeuD family)